MTALKDLADAAALQQFLKNNTNAVVCFSATWCGPCKASKPTLEQMAAKYEADTTKAVKFGIVYEENLGDAVDGYDIRAFPTYALFVLQKEVDRVEGVNFDGVTKMIDKAGCLPNTGQSLGGGSGAAAVSPEEARALRLARLGGGSAAPAPAPAEEPKKEDDKEMKEAPKQEAVKGEEDVEMKDAEPEPRDPCANLDQGDLTTLTESMGFPLLRAQKGLLYSNTGSIEGAIEWLTQHQDDADIDEPIPADSVGVAQSYKCNDCGKILSNMANLELHANKTGHSDFEESTQCVKILTPEEKAKKVQELKALLKAKRAEREEAEKVDDVDREKQRRMMGKEMSKTKEQLESEQRKREILRRKREKQAFKKERERLRQELAKDKAERMANKGKLTSKLGKDGYKPDGIQYDQGDEEEQQEVKKPKTSAGPSVARIDEYIKKVSSYRAGGDGGKCLKVLSLYVGNVVDKPTEDKFKTINMENKAFKAKVKPFVGAKQLLMAIGFAPNNGGDALVLKEDFDPELLSGTRDKLKGAFDAYNK